MHYFVYIFTLLLLYKVLYINILKNIVLKHSQIIFLYNYTITNGYTYDQMNNYTQKKTPQVKRLY